jgi:hypothetical protein
MEEASDRRSANRQGGGMIVRQSSREGAIGAAGVVRVRWFRRGVVLVHQPCPRGWELLEHMLVSAFSGSTN